MAVFVATTTLVREPQAPGARVTELSSTITSPNCGQRKAETMPTDAWHIFYECTERVTPSSRKGLLRLLLLRLAAAPAHSESGAWRELRQMTNRVASGQKRGMDRRPAFGFLPRIVAARCHAMSRLFRLAMREFSELGLKSNQGRTLPLCVGGISGSALVVKLRRCMTCACRR